MMTSREFLSLLFGHPSLEGLLLTVWDRQTKGTAVFTLPDIAAAAANAEARAETCDVYCGVCPYTAIEPGSRGNAKHAGALVGLWADIDVYHDGAHARSDLPPDDVAAFDLLYECSKPPSAVVSSGYGLHAWWIFREPFLIRTEADRVEAARMAAGWNDHVASRAKRHGWHVDPVGDLARVLRIAGTKNFKRGQVRAVAITKGKATT